MGLLYSTHHGTGSTIGVVVGEYGAVSGVDVVVSGDTITGTVLPTQFTQLRTNGAITAPH